MFTKNLILVLAVFEISLAAEDGKYLFYKYGCNSCHSTVERLNAPSFKEIRDRYGTSKKAIEKVARLIIKPNPSNWPGFAYMPPFNISFEEAKKLAEYVLIYSQNEKVEKKDYYYYESNDVY